MALEGFQSTRPLRGATVGVNFDCEHNRRFQSTRPLRGATRLSCDLYDLYAISIHAPLAGRDELQAQMTSRRGVFQSTRPLRGATIFVDYVQLIVPISIHAPLAGRDATASGVTSAGAISIHAPLAGRDDYVCYFLHGHWVISIHAPLAGRDRCTAVLRCAVFHFNPRAPCGARQKPPLSENTDNGISIHAPLAGRDVTTFCFFRLEPVISIHAPLAGRDIEDHNPNQKDRNFNPRAPCGARRETCAYTARYVIFQSTRPLRGATCYHPLKAFVLGISIHAPLAGRDE